MTENEAIDELNMSIDFAKMCTENPERKREVQGYETATKALEEIQQYRSIGTVEECRTAMEMQHAKKPRPIDYKKYIGIVENAKFLRDAYWCPNCHQTVNSGSFCIHCGQKLDWSDEE
jgi:hypothetical protein